MIFAAIFVLLMGGAMLRFPEVVWTISESWKSSSAAEPSDLYLLVTRIGGGFCLLAGIAGVVALIFLQ